jgi:tRNA1Val (adenine37-N6)-methyltransferase
MPNTWFQFQQFRVNQDRCGMKVSTDAVLLGALAQAKSPKRILDIGTGTGVIALMMAQRFSNANITAVELDSDAASQASENFEESDFSARLELVHGGVQDYDSSRKFDLVVSNPPYFSNHLPTTNLKRQRALHTDSLSFQELVEAVERNLSADGEFWVILPPKESAGLEEMLCNKGFHCSTSILIQDNPKLKFHRIVSSFSRHQKEKQVEEIALKNEEGSFSEAYKKLISGFLLGY